MSTKRLIEKTKERLSREVGAIYKPHGDHIRFALAFPSTYYVGMSNLGLQIVYRLINEQETALCERVFLPDPADMDDATKPGQHLFTMESQTPVRDFDVLAFSLSYELDYPNVLKLLALSGIPELSSERDAQTHHVPLVIAGGPASTFNPETLAPFIDLYVIGEAEEVMPEIIDVLVKYQGMDRPELLRKLAELEGVYVPRFYEPEYNEDGTLRGMNVAPGIPEHITRRWTANLDDYDATSLIVTRETEFSNMVLAEVARGCGRHCRFCVAGYAFLPPRARSDESILQAIDRMNERVAEKLGHDPRIGLLSASVFDHPSSTLVCQSLAERDRLFSISSTRADTLNKDIAEVLRKGGHETITIAPEAGTYRLRRAINKVMPDETVINAANSAWEAGFRKLKLYFMIGLPTETETDLVSIPTLVRQISELAPWEKVTVSVSCFVPKPWTPFQWAPMDSEKELGHKLDQLQRALRPIKRVSILGESPREAVVQGVFARGDRRLKDALLLMSRENISWRAAFREGGIDPSAYAQRQRIREEVMPWDHVDLGVSKEYLWSEYMHAMNSIATRACPLSGCNQCGVCGGK